MTPDELKEMIAEARRLENDYGSPGHQAEPSGGVATCGTCGVTLFATPGGGS